MVSDLFWFHLVLNSSASPWELTYTMSHLLARRYCVMGFSDCHGEGWVRIYSHHESSEQLLWHVCAAGFILGSSKPANCATPGQSLGKRTPPSPLVHFSNLPWHGFGPFQRALGLGTACTDIDAGQRPSPIGSSDADALYWWRKSLVVWTWPALVSWLMAQMDPGSA